MKAKEIKSVTILFKYLAILGAVLINKNHRPWR